MKRNRELFLKLAAKFRAFPKCYDQSTWGSATKPNELVPCGTVACVAGHAGLIAGWHAPIVNPHCRIEGQDVDT